MCAGGSRPFLIPSRLTARCTPTSTLYSSTAFAVLCRPLFAHSPPLQTHSTPAPSPLSPNVCRRCTPSHCHPSPTPVAPPRPRLARNPTRLRSFVPRDPFAPLALPSLTHLTSTILTLRHNGSFPRSAREDKPSPRAHRVYCKYVHVTSRPVASRRVASHRIASFAPIC
jgi:hypothetical protein